MLFIVGSQLCGCVSAALGIVLRWAFLVWHRFICAPQQPASVCFLVHPYTRAPSAAVIPYMRAKTKPRRNDACVTTLREASSTICAHFAPVRRRDSQKWFFCHLSVFVFFITNFHFSRLLLMRFFCHSHSFARASESKISAHCLFFRIGRMVEQKTKKIRKFSFRLMCCRTDTAPFTTSTSPKTGTQWWASQLHNLLGLERKWIVQLFSCRFYSGNSNFYASSLLRIFASFISRCSSYAHMAQATRCACYIHIRIFFFTVHWLWIWLLSLCVCVMSLVYLQILDYAKRSLVHPSFSLWIFLVAFSR